MYEFWCDYVKPNFNKNAKLLYMDTDSFIVQVNTYDINKDIAKDIKIRFDTSNYKLYRPLINRKIKKVIGLMKDEVGE